MFAAVMDDCVASRIDTHPSVETVLPDVGTPVDLDESTPSKQRRRKREIEEQSGASPDLRFLSAPRGPGLSVDDTDSYLYDESAGEGITVYVIDTGANLENPDYEQMEVEPVWLWPSEEVWNDLATGDFSQPYGSFTDTANHGSCMVSKVAGFSWGVAKKAAVVVVKLITGSTEANLGDILQSSPLTALAMVQNDIMARSAANVPVNGKVIVNMSFGLNYDPGDPGDRFWIREYEIAIRNLLALDVVLVTTAGNHRGEPGRSDNVDNYPAVLAGLYPDMIVVGGVTEYGVEYQYSQGGPLVRVWGPSVDVMCAAHVGEDSVEEDGTSVASAIVSGLAAYFMALDPGLQRPGTGLTARAVKSRIIQYSWARENFLQDPDRVFPVAIWNGLQSPLDCADSDGDSGSGSDDSKMRRRDTTDGDSCPRLSSTVSRSSSTTTPTALVTSSASGSRSSNPPESCNNGKEYTDLSSCQAGCRSGTCSRIVFYYKCECQTPNGPERGGLD